MIRHTQIQITKLLVLFVVSCSFSLYACQNASADNYVVQGPFVFPAPGAYIPTPAQVTGKEYTDYLDKNDASPPVGDPLRVLRFDGAGGTQNGYNYSGSFLSAAGGAIPDPGREVDAIAGPIDALFAEVNNNQSALLLSSTGDPIAPVLSHSITGGIGVWATIGQVDAPSANDPGVVDLDGLEVWGSEGFGDSDHFSLEGDPGFISIWTYAAGTSVPFVTTAQIAAALGDADLLPLIDLDALMVGSESILFSIRPTPDGQFDGGEIWFWDFANPATFLVHGGVTWDTANDVTKLLGSENIDGLEAVSAVPEPSSIVLAAFGLLGLIACRWRRKR